MFPESTFLGKNNKAYVNGCFKVGEHWGTGTGTDCGGHEESYLPSELRLQGRLWYVSVVQKSSLWYRACHSSLHGCSPVLGKETRASRQIWGRSPAALHSELARLLTRGITQIQDFKLNQPLVTVNSSRSQRQQLPLVSEQSPLSPSHSKIKALPECYGVCPVYKSHVGRPLNVWIHFSAKALSPSLTHSLTPWDLPSQQYLPYFCVFFLCVPRALAGGYLLEQGQINSDHNPPEHNSHPITDINCQ